MLEYLKDLFHWYRKKNKNKNKQVNKKKKKNNENKNKQQHFYCKKWQLKQGFPAKLKHNLKIKTRLVHRGTFPTKDLRGNTNQSSLTTHVAKYKVTATFQKKKNKSKTKTKTNQKQNKLTWSIIRTTLLDINLLSV